VSADVPWWERGLELRNRALASPRFRRLAMRFPLTRWIARRRARRLFDLCAGFVYSQVLLACVELRVLELLAEAPRSAEALAEKVALPPERALRLLRAAVALGLVERRAGGRFGLGAQGAALVGNPAVAAMVAHHPLLYADLADPVALLRGEGRATELGRYWPYADGAAGNTLQEEEVAPYSALMSASQSLVAEQVLDAYPLRRHRRLLDVGGGDGTFLVRVAEHAPDLELVLFDLPPVAARARRRLEEAGLAQRAQALGGDFRSEPLPGGADVISLVRVVHDQDDDTALALLASVRRALPADGVLLLAEPMSGTAGAEPIGDAYFGFYLLAMGSGRTRTPAELQALLARAGFTRTRLAPTPLPLQARLLVARP